MIDDVLIDAVDVAVPLRLVGEIRARGVDDARRGIPACAELDAVGAAELGDAIVGLAIERQARPHLPFAHVRIEAEIGMGEQAGMIVELRREVIGFRLALAAHPPGVLLAKMEVQEQRGVVIEILRIHWPRAVLLFQRRTDDVGAKLSDGVLEQKRVLAPPGRIDVAHALVGRRQRTVHRRDHRREPALLDGAARRAERIIVVGMQAQALAGRREAAGHEHRRETQHPLAFIESVSDLSRRNQSDLLVSISVWLGAAYARSSRRPGSGSSPIPGQSTKPKSLQKVWNSEEKILAAGWLRSEAVRDKGAKLHVK